MKKIARMREIWFSKIGALNCLPLNPHFQLLRPKTAWVGGHLSAKIDNLRGNLWPCYQHLRDCYRLLPRRVSLPFISDSN